MNKFISVVVLGVTLLHSGEQSNVVQQTSIPSGIAMQKEQKESFCMTYIKKTYGIPVTCHPGAICCYVCCCPCINVAGLYLTIKERAKS